MATGINTQKPPFLVLVPHVGGCLGKRTHPSETMALFGLALLGTWASSIEAIVDWRQMG